eukprot:122106-Rhodomonas_salina.1
MRWGTVCDHGFTTKDAMVVCNAMGLEGGSVFKRFGAHFYNRDTRGRSLCYVVLTACPISCYCSSSRGVAAWLRARW